MPAGKKVELLKSLGERKRFSFYRLENKYTPELEKYVVSTPFTRRILNSPEVFGCGFTEDLQKTVAGIIQHLPVPGEISRLDPAAISVVNFLRSGLNFGIREALYRALGYNTHCSSFITSQRRRDRYGRWFIQDDQYRKLELPDQATIFIGEVVATGVTIDNGLAILFHQAKNLGHPIKNLYFFTIGCHKIEKILQKYDRLFRKAFSGYRKTVLFYLEGKFHLADSRTRLRLKQQGTDLLRHPALLAPEFERSQFGKVVYPLERCVIYDAGSRAFNPSRFLREVGAYWEELLRLARRGLTLKEAYFERWPAGEYLLSWPEFRDLKSRTWKGLNEGSLRDIYRYGGRPHRDAFQRRSGSSRALVEICERRLNSLYSQING